MTPEKEDHVTEQLNVVAKLMDEDRHLDAVNLVNDLKTQYPAEFRVIFTWLVVASFCRNHKAVCEHAPAIKSLTTDQLTLAKIEYLTSSSAWEIEDFDTAIEAQLNAVMHFVNCAKQDMYPERQEKVGPKPLSLKADATDYAKTIFADLHNDKIECSPFYGTLLGFIRQGGVIGHDKDIDLMCHIDIYDRVVEWLKDHGYVNAGPQTFTNYRGFKHPDIGVQIDLSGYKRENGQCVSGFFRTNSKEYQLVQRFKEFDLISTSKWGIELYIPTNALNILKGLYGEKWEESDPNYVPFIMDNTLEDTLGSKYFRFHHFLKFWNRGQVEKLPNLIGILLEKYPSDHLLNLVKTVLIKNRTISRTERSK